MKNAICNPVRRRNKANTIQNILNAVAKIISEKGVEELGINRIAEEAGVSKVLIYRYFGNLETLLAHYIREGGVFIPGQTEQKNDNLCGDERMSSADLLNTYRHIRQSPPAYQLLKNISAEDNSVNEATRKALDEVLTSITTKIALPEGVDKKTMAALLVGSMTYLTILSKKNRSMMGINLTSESGWMRLEYAVIMIIHALGKVPKTEEKSTLQPVNLG
ncbi:TetR/AcrR family transcriptional regulator [Tellurirhabdus bombi]|uniref:TetR/AcrR family transcriptional regulator n=1 Tax=Tellurirhabdus bombi TaxID=2907205 RepID=UPI001F356048|nr:TetR/AcrR family transcriptional regulator [Tellurirhabdus bombi]